MAGKPAACVGFAAPAALHEHWVRGRLAAMGDANRGGGKQSAAEGRPAMVTFPEIAIDEVFATALGILVGICSPRCAADPSGRVSTDRQDGLLLNSVRRPAHTQ